MIVEAGDDVSWIGHSIDIDDLFEWTVRLCVVQEDRGGLGTDDVHGVVETRQSSHLVFNVQNFMIHLVYFPYNVVRWYI